LDASGYRLGWYACVSLVLLRVAVGWHCLYEGLWKIESRRDGAKPFSAEGYIANSSGPLRSWFRAQLDDPDGLERLDPPGAVRRWERTVAEFDRRYHLTTEQLDSARAKIRELEIAKDNYFNGTSIAKRVSAYRDEIEKVVEDERGQPMFVRDHSQDRRKDLAKARDELVGPIDGWTKSLRDHITAELAPEQLEQASQERLTGLSEWLHLPFPLEWPQNKIERINIVTMLGLTVCGGLLVIGLFSRLAALGAAAMIAAFYACNPAPPLGSAVPGDPGHYMYVNKELIECLAALALATIPTGRWLGVDALIHGVTRWLGSRLRRNKPQYS
jgi:uncharacterized membrane protein YphA (DoxX/SURF4 family)